jgi:hypothetical protein
MSVEADGIVTPTELALAEMMIEPVPHHICDSGGSIGRAYQQNQAMAQRSPSVISALRAQRGLVETYGPCYMPVWQFLADRLTYSPEMTRRFRAWVHLEPADISNPDRRCTNSVDQWPDALVERGWLDDDYVKDDTWNTCNNEHLLSQEVLSRTFGPSAEWLAVMGDSVPPIGQHERYVMVSIHGGADIRGGYSDVRVFVANESWFYEMSDALVACDTCGWWAEYAHSEMWGIDPVAHALHLSQADGQIRLDGSPDYGPDACELESDALDYAPGDDDDAVGAVCPSCRQGDSLTCRPVSYDAGAY